MTSESPGFNPYEAVLTDLRSKRDQLDQTIKLLEAQMAGSAVGGGTSGMSQNDSLEAGAFLGMTIADAAKRLLAIRKKPLSNSEMLAGIQAGGLVMTANNPLNIVGSVLYRRFNDVGDIVRIGRGMWGLPEWYPNRSFKKKTKEVSEDATNETSEHEQLSTPKLVAAKA